VRRDFPEEPDNSRLPRGQGFGSGGFHRFPKWAGPRRRAKEKKKNYAPQSSDHLTGCFTWAGARTATICVLH